MGEGADEVAPMRWGRAAGVFVVVVRHRGGERWGKRRDEGRFEGWRRIRDLNNLGAEGDGGEERFCRAGIGATRFFLKN